MTDRDHGTTTQATGQSTQCARCGRRLTDPVSIARGVGPVCWAKCNGGLFEQDLEAPEQEWTRREQLLRGGGEIDLGANWRYIAYDPGMALQLPQTMRVSMRYRDGHFEAYGVVSGPKPLETVFLRSTDLRSAYAAAIQAGPASNAIADRIMRAQARRARRQMRRRVA